MQNWVSRTNYPALNVVQTGPTEMSLYVQSDYGQKSAHLQRYSLRLDGFSSLRAPLAGGELLTRPLTFTASQLLLNFATSRGGRRPRRNSGRRWPSAARLFAGKCRRVDRQ